MSEMPTPSAVDVVTQLVTGPSLREVASKTLRPALETLYPQLDLDPQLTLVVTPAWVVVGDRVIPGDNQIESLTGVLVRLALSGSSVTYIDGEHFLAREAELLSPIHLPVKIAAIGCLLNELAPLLFIAYQEQQVDYWDDFTYPGQPRWQQMSDALRNVWNVDASLGWDADQCAMAQAVFNHPDKLQRVADPYQTRACLIDIDQDEGTDRRHRMMLDTAVIIGTVEKRTLIVTHSVVNGFQRFDSVEDIAKALPRRFRQGTPGASFKWRLVEPQGLFFDHQACTLIALEADALGAINFFEGSTLSNLFPHSGATGNPDRPTPRLEPHIERLRPLLPDWLSNAPAADQTRYSRHLLDLTTVQHEHNGKTFQSELASLQTFTRDALTQQIRKDHPTASEVNLDDIEISITSLQVWGTFVWPGNTQTQSLSLMDLALQNLAGQPLGNKTVRYKDASAVPDWMTVAYVESLVNTVNIGETYPAYLKKHLVDDIRQATSLQALYTSQLAIELPLLALQHKIRARAGIDELGYRYVVAALANTHGTRHVDGHEIVIRELAFVAHRSTSRADKVANMYVIGPRETDKGPCVLYQPLFEQTLLQYPSHANLLYAIEHSRQLRESVLAWLPDDARFNYSQFVFTASLPSVWTIPQLLVNPSTALDMSGPVALGTPAIESDVLTTLHKANVQAIIAQADRQSVSNAEARWASLKRGGWAMFNAALPFLGRSVGTAAWIWQILDDLQEVSDEANQQPGKVAWSAIADILLALGMVLAHRAAVGNRPLPESKPATITEEMTEEMTPLPTAPLKLIEPLRLPDITGTELSANHEASLNGVAALKRSPVALNELLDRFKIDKPKALGTAASTGAHRFLHAHQERWYAPVGERWFEVMLNEHGDVQIIDSRQPPPRVGPLLSRAGGAQWVIDLRLRLRGGGLSARRRKAREKRNTHIEALKTDITAFDQTMQTKETRLQEDRQALQTALPATRAQARERYLATLVSQSQAYEAIIEKIKALQLEESIPNYRTVMIERLEMQLFLGQEWLSQNIPEYQQQLQSVMAMIASGTRADDQAYIQAQEVTTDQTQKIIEKIEFAQTRFEELERLGKEAVEVRLTYSEALPGYELHDLKLLQISLAENICLKTGTTAAHADARKVLAELIEDAALNIQSSLSLIEDESLIDLRERIDALSNVCEQFSAVDQRFADFAEEYPEQINTERLAHVRKRVVEFKARSDVRLADLLRNKHVLEPLPGPSRPAPAAGNRKIIKTRFKGTLVGERKKSLNGEDTDLVEVRTQLTGVIATFHEKSPGEWVEHVTSTPTPAKTVPSVEESVASATALVDGLAQFYRQNEAHIKRGARIPVEIEEIYHQHAARLRRAGDAIDAALTAANQSADSTGSAERLGHSLSEAATALYEKGTAARIQLIKQQPPTAARVQWLKSRNDVRIAKTVTRRLLKGSRRDYMDEYEVRDKDGGVLWYAHFHYANANDAVSAFTAGHMKTAAQRRLGRAFYQQGKSNEELIEIYRSKIDSTLAQALFFSPATPGASAPVQR
ncbi:DUF6543 domain-containing protein [Pseudomonas sp. SWRI99]|uniref:dermonecrotic toxin domain-containing protein n=1 Tax=Pseudomonas sp. SWRI99 TaxID=2745506 RepID=UPI0016441FB5|nr:DUF6543 domain-containing protein [Pseudomonas sp. SWRI99]MBC3776970.1 hypothetical protein [Pseudomonas sp. SWRI99]